MKKITAILFSFCLCTMLCAQNFEWAQKIGGVQDEQSISIISDRHGYIYNTGYFRGTVDFDPGTGVKNFTANDTDIFVTKTDSLGNLIWAKQLGGSSNDQGLAITVDALGNVYTTGFFEGTTDFDPGSGIFNLTAVGFDVFVSKLDDSGNFVWAKQMGGPIWDIGESIVVDINGNVYTTGYFTNTADFDPGSNTYNLTADPTAAIEDVFVSKLDASGNFVWAKQIGGPDHEIGYDITTDATGNLYLSGEFSGTVDFDPESGVVSMTSAGGLDIFVCKLNTSGSLLWAKQMGGTIDDGAKTIITDASDNVYVAGYFSATADFDPGVSSYNLTSAGDNDIFISKLDGSGNFILARQMGGLGQDGAFSIAIDTAQNIYTTGHFNGISDFDPGSGSFNLYAGSRDIFISKLDRFGNFEWAEDIGSTASNFGNSITVDSSANVYVAGYFSGTVDFNSNGPSYFLTSAGYADIFIKKISQNNISTSIKQNNFNNNVVKFFPNPAQDQVQLSFERRIHNGNIKLMNTRGQVEMEETNITGNNFTIEISDIPQGIYFIEIREQAEIHMLKVVKN